MKKVIVRKFRTIGIVLLGIVLISTIFIVCSTEFINKENYRKFAWEFIKHDKSIIDWNSASVDYRR